MDTNLMLKELLSCQDRGDLMQWSMDYEDELKTILEEASWKPIESAPTDELILIAYKSLYDPNQFIRIVAFKDSDGDWYRSGGEIIRQYKPLYWQKIPEPPKED